MLPFSWVTGTVDLHSHPWPAASPLPPPHLGDGDALLLHGLEERLVVLPHLVELVNAADALVCAGGGGRRGVDEGRGRGTSLRGSPLRTRAPASSACSPETGSRTRVTVRPVALVVLPHTYTPLQAGEGGGQQ